MRGWRSAALAAALMIVASTAWAIPPPNYTGAKQNPDSTAANVAAGFSADSIKRSFRTLTDGTQIVNEASKDRDLLLRKIGAMQTTLVPGARDTSTAFYTHGWGPIHLELYPSYYDTTAAVAANMGSPFSVLLALKVRGGLTSGLDRSSTYPWLQHRPNEIAAGSPKADTVGSFTLRNLQRTTIGIDTTTVGYVNTVMKDEIPIVLIPPGRPCATATVGATGFGFITDPNRTLQLQYAQGTTQGVTVDLVDALSGFPWVADWTSFELRCVAVYDSTGTARHTGANARISVRIDAYGAR